MSLVLRIHQSEAEHDAACPAVEWPVIEKGLTIAFVSAPNRQCAERDFRVTRGSGWYGQDSELREPDLTRVVIRHYRVTRPLGYSPSTPGHLDVSVRQGYYTNACCATFAASTVRHRLAEKGFGKLSELDVQVWP